MPAADPDIVSKSAFAHLANVSAPRVTQWIKEGKIHGDAMVGEGRSARIRVSVACAQLKRSLDIAQRLGNGIGTRLDQPPPEATARVPAPPAVEGELFDQAPPQATAPRAPVADPIEEQLKREKLEEYQRRNRVAAKQEAETGGRLTDAAMAQQAIGRSVARTIGLFEGALADMAEAVASRYDLAKRDVMVLLRDEFRKARAAAAVMLRREAEEMPELVDFDLGVTPEVETSAEADD
jgi:hypothetical protein